MPPRTSYELTEAGRALEPVIAAIATWAERYGPEPAEPCHEEWGRVAPWHCLPMRGAPYACASPLLEVLA